MITREQQPMTQDPRVADLGSDIPSFATPLDLSPNGEVLVTVTQQERVIRGLAQPDEDLLLGIALVVSNVQSAKGVTRVHPDPRYPQVRATLAEILSIYGGNVDPETMDLILNGKEFAFMAKASKHLHGVPAAQNRVGTVFTGSLMARRGYESLVFHDRETADVAVKLFNKTFTPLRLGNTVNEMGATTYRVRMYHPDKVIDAVAALTTVKDLLPGKIVAGLLQTATPAYYQRTR